MQVMSLVLKEARELAQDHLDNKWHSCGSVVAAHGLNCPSACGTFPEPGSPALEVGFLTTAPQESHQNNTS